VNRLALQTSHQIFLSRFYQGMIGIVAAGRAEYLIINHMRNADGMSIKDACQKAGAGWQPEENPQWSEFRGSTGTDSELSEMRVQL